VKRLATALVSAAILGSCAIAFGLQGYRDSPRGMLLYTPSGPCPEMSHPFGVNLAVALMLSAGVCLLVALGCFAVRLLPVSVRAKTNFRAVGITAVLVLPLLVLPWLGKTSIEAKLPLQPVPGCASHAHYGQFRYSLWTGDLGLAVFIWDCIVAQARFPTLDVFYANCGAA
jgi:hypothetical protein